MADGQAARAIACERCGASPGMVCTYPSGHHYSAGHRERREGAGRVRASYSEERRAVMDAPRGLAVRIDDDGRPGWVLRHFPLVTSIHVGRCGDRGGFGGKWAHAHPPGTGWGDQTGMLCFSDGAAFNPERPTTTFLHEYAHLTDPPRWGGYRWSHHHGGWRAGYQRLLRDWGFADVVRDARPLRGIRAA